MQKMIDEIIFKDELRDLYSLRMGKIVGILIDEKIPGRVKRSNIAV